MAWMTSPRLMYPILFCAWVLGDATNRPAANSTRVKTFFIVLSNFVFSCGWVTGHAARHLVFIVVFYKDFVVYRPLLWLLFNRCLFRPPAGKNKPLFYP